MYGDTLTWGGYSSDYPWRVAIHGRSGLTWGGGGGIAVAIHGWSGVCHSNSGVRGYSDIGGGIAVTIHGWSGDCQCNSGVCGYSDIRGGGGGIAVAIHGEWQSTDGPGTVSVTPVYGDTLTWRGA